VQYPQSTPSLPVPPPLSFNPHYPRSLLATQRRLKTARQGDTSFRYFLACPKVVSDFNPFLYTMTDPLASVVATLASKQSAFALTGTYPPPLLITLNHYPLTSFSLLPL
jgi:hypothetical protein